MKEFKYKNALEEWSDSKSPKCPLPSETISRLRDMPSSDEREERHRRMIEHGDVDPDYFNR